MLAHSLVHVQGLILGFYATELYLPGSMLAYHLREFLRTVRGKKAVRQQTRLPRVSWKSLADRDQIFLCETRKSDGNVRLSELGILCQFARALPKEGLIFEIGTFNGRTALNMSLNADKHKVITLDLPRDNPTKLQIEVGEQQYVDKDVSGAVVLRNSARFAEAAQRVHQVYGDSATFDYGPFEKKCDLIFVDGSHAYEYVLSDSAAAFRLCRDEAVVLWHDYGVWDGVTRGLEEIEAKQNLGIKHIEGTSLAVLRMGSQFQPAAVPA